MFRARAIDATKGPIVSQIFLFAIPLILTTLIQQLFNAVDIAVLGNMADTTSVAAVGATTTIVSLIINLFSGIAGGAKIVIARLVGKGDNEELEKTVDTAILLALGFGVFIAIIGFVMAPLCMKWIACPSECFGDAVLYLRMYLLSAPVILLYSYGAAILTSMGDTRKPLEFAIISGALNVVLNIILCWVLPQKVMAVAIATAVSQTLAAVLVMIRLNSFEGMLKINLSKLSFHIKSCLQLLRFGIPLSLESVMFPLASLQITAAINSFGVACMAGNSVSVSIESITAAFRGAFSVSCATFMGQNLGAENHPRVRKVLWYNFGIAMAVNVALSALVLFTNELWMPFFLKGDMAAVEYALIRNEMLTAALPIATVNTMFGSAIHAFGYPVLGVINNVSWVLLFRIFWMGVVYPHFQSYTNLIMCFTVSWICIMLCNIVMFSIVYFRYRKGKYKKI